VHQLVLAPVVLVLQLVLHALEHLHVQVVALVVLALAAQVVQVPVVQADQEPVVQVLVVQVAVRRNVVVQVVVLADRNVRRPHVAVAMLMS